MPDLTTHPACTCGNVYAVGLPCKHIEAVKKSGWNAELDPSNQAKKNDNGECSCPECDGPVSIYNVGV